MKRLHVDLLLRLRLVDSYCASRELLSGAALATGVGVLVEVPITLSHVAIVNCTGW